MRLATTLAALPLLAGCASGGSGSRDAGRSGSDGTVDGPLRDGPATDGRTDASPADAMRMDVMVMTDAGDPCGDVRCGPFERCNRMLRICEPYPECLAPTDCGPGEVCRHRFCLPSGADPDGDGVTAATDCDETNPAISPSATEVCNGTDDDCDGRADDGDPGLLCAGDPAGGICISGRCGCPTGLFDLDRNPTNGCECMASPAVDTGTSCAGAIDVGTLSDVGQTATVSGNVLPPEREVWYRFRATDAPDSDCDRFHVRVQFRVNPSDAYAFTVFRGSCDMAACDGAMLYTQYDWATDFRNAASGTGECPCRPEPASPGNNFCRDNSADFFVRVRRRPGTPLACDGYVLELTNGVYRT
ncbi:MAG: MopE-related protein [Myxococcota bacterium]|nr:MopE-related protein [Myxococcota bacterium]MDW8362467.1 MopE-related protein [Myxococcales bacterium]